MTKAGRSEIFRAAFRFADLRTSSSKTPGWDVTSLVLKGEMDTVFLVRSESDPEARRKWREMLNAFNLAQR
ncbi:MAG: hypothetical protein H7301_07255 [Cryobacterium sp.]|nr:hypothetical protein [Oligoflexia bacterium]